MSARSGYRFVSTLFWICLTLWFAFLVAAGVTATFNFIVLPDANLTMNDFSTFKPDDSAEHGRLAAGMVLEKVFTLTDFIQVLMGPLTAIALLLLIVVYGSPLRRPANLLRISCVSLAIVIAGYHVFLQAPEMNRELRAYWDAARAGDVSAAEAHQANFNAFHPRASAMLQINAGLLLLTIIASACAVVPVGKWSHRHESQQTLETPALSG